MISRAAAALLLFVLCSPAARASPQARVPGGLRGCINPQITLDGWEVTCDGAVISLADDPGAGSCTAEECVERWVGSWTSAIAAGTERRETRLALAGAPRRLIILDERPRGANGIRVRIAVLDLAEGMRILSCYGGPEHEARCHGAFKAMATLAWRAAIPSFIPRRAAGFVGRTYDPPSGCTARASDTDGGIACGDDSSFMWQVTRDPAADQAALIQPYSRMKLIEKKPISCAIDGVASTCRSFRASDGRNIGFDVGHAVVRGKPIVVMCFNWTGTARVPKACADALTFRALPNPE